MSRVIETLQKHLNYRRCDDEFYLTREQLSILKGELLALEIIKPPTETGGE